MLRKGIYPYENTDDWAKLNETSLPQKEEFYSNLSMEDITDADYAQAKIVCKDIEIKKIRRLSWFVSSKQYIFVIWCIWELQKYVS